MTLRDTFEMIFRRRLLDLVYSQWSKLGAPFSDSGPARVAEVLDPEALLWCSLEFLPTEPRLTEVVLEWLARRTPYLVRQRVQKISRRSDPRAILWHTLNPGGADKPDHSAQPAEACHGLSAAAELVQFARTLPPKITSASEHPRLGRIDSSPATLLLRARDLLGHDIRHVLLVYLLAHPQGCRLRDVQAWSGYSYRALAGAAERWQAARLVTIDSGYCRLLEPEPFRTLLQLRSSSLVLVNWLSLFEISIHLLRNLAKASRNGFDEESPLVSGLAREAAEQLESLLPLAQEESTSSVEYLLHAFPQAVS